MMRALWNEKFSREGYLYGKKPNTFLASQMHVLAPQSDILFLGEGEGRNACYAASKGFNATALDASDVGLEKARALAEEMGVAVTIEHQDLQTWQPKSQYDAVMTSFLHLSEPLRTEAFRSALKALKPSALFIGEFFSTKQLPLSSGGPKDEALLYTVDSLREIFSLEGAEIVLLEACSDLLDEGTGHQGEAELIRIIVKKR